MSYVILYFKNKQKYTDINELDALVNIDFKTRKINLTKKSLNIIRLGTSGSINNQIPVNSFIVSSYGLGFDGLAHYYKKKNIRENYEKRSKNKRKYQKEQIK